MRRHYDYLAQLSPRWKEATQARLIYPFCRYYPGRLFLAIGMCFGFGSRVTSAQLLWHARNPAYHCRICTHSANYNGVLGKPHRNRAAIPDLQPRGCPSNKSDATPVVNGPCIHVHHIEDAGPNRNRASRESTRVPFLQW
jgi:hypothetical protein